MKIAANKADSFIKSLDNSLIAALVYGPDTGLVSQRAKSIADQIVEDLSDPFAVVELNLNDLKDGPAALIDEMMAISLMGGKKLIRIREVGNSLSKRLKESLEHVSEHKDLSSFLLITAGDLKPGSLRTLFEQGKQIAAIPCYQDDVRTIRPVIIQELRKYELSFDDEVVAFMSEHCRGDRLVVLKEIEKLALYMGDGAHVTLEDTIICVGETTESTFDDICNAVAAGQYKNIEIHLKKAFLQGLVPVAIIRSAQRYFGRLHLVLGKMEEGTSQEQAVNSLNPRIFFKQLPIFNMHINRWSQKKAQSLWRAMSLLYQAELECKKSDNNAELMCSRLLMKVASLR